MPVTRHRDGRLSPVDLAPSAVILSYLVKGLASAQDISPLTTPSRCMSHTSVEMEVNLGSLPTF